MLQESQPDESLKVNIDESSLKNPSNQTNDAQNGVGINNDSNNLSKEERKRKRYLELVAHQKANRKRLKAERKAKTSEEKPDEERIPKKEKQKQIRQRMEEALRTGQRICVDLSLESHMSQKECGKLAQQLCRLYGSNRAAEDPAHVYFTGLDKQGCLYTQCVRKNCGFDSYLVDMSEQKHTELFDQTELVYLTPDSSNVLETIDKSKVYVIGGLVDETVTKDITFSKAKHQDISTARLPIEEHLVRAANTTAFSKILAVNQVFDILLTFMATGDWCEALVAGVPRRKGYVRPEPSP